MPGFSPSLNQNPATRRFNSDACITLPLDQLISMKASHFSRTTVCAYRLTRLSKQDNGATAPGRVFEPYLQLFENHKWRWFIGCFVFISKLICFSSWSKFHSWRHNSKIPLEHTLEKIIMYLEISLMLLGSCLPGCVLCWSSLELRRGGGYSMGNWSSARCLFERIWGTSTAISSWAG